MDIVDASNSGRLRRGWWFAALLAAAVLTLLPACSKTSATFRYRLNFAVQVDGEVKSASSIIEVLYYGFGGDVGASGASSYASSRGVAPVIDLGIHGMLFAGMEHRFNYYSWRKKEFNLACKRPADAEWLPKVYGLHAIELEKLREGKRELADDNYPPFIWFPDGGTWQDAKELCPEEFSRVIGADVTLKSVSIEPAPGAPLLHKLEIHAPWLDQMRIDQDREGIHWKTDDEYVPSNTFIEW
jgi:hypothetical protein